MSYLQAMKELRREEPPRRILQREDVTVHQPKISRGNGRLKYESSKEDRDWLKNCLFGTLKECFPWSEIGDKILESCENNLCISFLGGDLVLTQEANKEAI